MLDFPQVILDRLESRFCTSANRAVSVYVRVLWDSAAACMLQWCPEPLASSCHLHGIYTNHGIRHMLTRCMVRHAANTRTMAGCQRAEWHVAMALQEGSDSACHARDLVVWLRASHEWCGDRLKYGDSWEVGEPDTSRGCS